MESQVLSLLKSTCTSKEGVKIYRLANPDTPFHVFPLPTGVVHEYIDVFIQSTLHDTRRLVEEGGELFRHHDLLLFFLTQLDNCQHTTVYVRFTYQ